MEKEQATATLEMLRRVVSQAKDDTALQNWGVIWVANGLCNGLGFLLTDWMFHNGYNTPPPFLVLWMVIIGVNLLTILVLLRGHRAGSRSFIETQIWAIWTTFIVAMVLTAVANWEMGLDRLFMPSVACVLAAVSFSSMGALMGRGWFVMAGVWAVLGLLVPFSGGHGFAMIGIAWFAAQGGGGVWLELERRKRTDGPRLV